MARGDYLVSHVAMCVQCHTPRDGKRGSSIGRACSGARRSHCGRRSPTRAGRSGSAHLYALGKVRTAFGFGRRGSVAVIPVLGVLCAGPVLVHVLGIHEMWLVARVASWIGYTWMELLFFFTWLNLAMDVVTLGARLLTSAVGRGPNPLVRHGKVTCLVLVGRSAGLCAYASVEASRVRVEHVRILTDTLPASVSRLRIAQISDVHLGLMVRRRQAVAIADLVDARPNHLDGLSEIFRPIPAPFGRFAVTGNHEFYAGIDASLDFTRRAGFTLLLKHRPVRASGALPQIDLQFSGQTHRGQLFPFQFLFRLAYPFLAGPYLRRADGTLYVSRGPAPGAPACGFYPLWKSRCWTSSEGRPAALRDIASSAGRQRPTGFPSPCGVIPR